MLLQVLNNVPNASPVTVTNADTEQALRTEPQRSLVATVLACDLNGLLFN